MPCRCGRLCSWPSPYICWFMWDKPGWGVCTGFRHFTPAGALCCLRTAEHLARDEQRGTHRMGRCRHSSDGGKSTFRPLAGHSILQEKQICQLNQLNLKSATNEVADLRMTKILFLHGFFATGSCSMALALKEAFDGRAIVLTPDLPLHPKEALEYIHDVCDKEKPDLLLGNSCGSFLAQMLAPIVGIPALLGNPHFRMTAFLQERMGEHEYKAPRKDGNQKLVIDESLVEEFAELEAVQLDCCNPYYKDRVWGLFGERDALAHYSPLFLEHYNNAHHFPGGHTPTPQEVKTWHVPLAVKMIILYSAKKERYFRHFKGGMYKYIHPAFDSETGERMVVYQALYGERAYWVRPEKCSLRR